MKAYCREFPVFWSLITSQLQNKASCNKHSTAHRNRTYCRVLRTTEYRVLQSTNGRVQRTAESFLSSDPWSPHSWRTRQVVISTAQHIGTERTIEYRVLQSTNGRVQRAYYREFPVFWSLITSQLHNKASCNNKHSIAHRNRTLRQCQQQGRDWGGGDWK